MAEIVTNGGGVTPQKGSAGLNTQVAGQATTVSGAAAATGGINAGSFIEADIDEQLFAFRSEDTALMSLMLKAKKVKVESPEVDHYMIDEQRSRLTVASDVTATRNATTVLPLAPADQQIAREHQTLLAKGVDGFAMDGMSNTPGKDLMLFVTGRDTTTGNPVVRAVNGPKQNASDAVCGIPAIPKGTTITVLANALYETQKEVEPDLIVPQPTRVYLQKRGMNQVVSDYFDAQRKRIPFSQALIAEQAILNFKRAGNRTLWSGRAGKMTVRVPKLGEQLIYCTEGIRWQFKRELQVESGKWTIEKLIGLAKVFFTGEDVPKSALLLAGKNLLESLQCIDFSKHPEIQISQAVNPIGWSVTRIHTVFGDIDIKREPTLDVLGWSNSGALIGEDRLVHYTYSQQHEFSDRVEGEEATRKGVVVWDGLALKGSCHIWIDGEGGNRDTDAFAFRFWESDKEPRDPQDGHLYYLACDCPGISSSARAGQIWKATVGTNESLETVVTWSEYNGSIEL